MIRWRLCLLVAVLVTLILPYATLFLPCGGSVEKEWLEQARRHLIRRLAYCDPAVAKRLQYAIDKYDHVCPWCVRFQPCLGIAHNIPWVPGITIDPEALRYCPEVGAEILFHEAQHDYFPWFGHAHFHERSLLCPLR